MVSQSILNPNLTQKLTWARLSLWPKWYLAQDFFKGEYSLPILKTQKILPPITQQSDTQSKWSLEGWKLWLRAFKRAPWNVSTLLHRQSTGFWISGNFPNFENSDVYWETNLTHFSSTHKAPMGWDLKLKSYSFRTYLWIVPYMHTTHSVINCCRNLGLTKSNFKSQKFAAP